LPPFYKAYILVTLCVFLAASIKGVRYFRHERDAIAAWCCGLAGIGGALVLARFVYVAWG
jgi:hypothetical protein